MNIVLISNFNIESLAQFLRTGLCPKSSDCTVTKASLGEVVPNSPHTEGAPDDFAVVWTMPDKTIAAFGRALSFETVREEDVLSEVHGFAEYIKAVGSKFRAVFLVSWTLPSYQRGYGMMDLGSDGIRALLIKMNLKLAEEIQSTRGMYLLDGQKWIENVGKNAYSPKLWYLAKTPFHPDVFKEAAGDINAAISGVTGNAKKLIVLDLDDTLWGGTVGDVGWQNLRLGGHDYVGEAFQDFQEALKALSRRGILLAIVSKNEESIALEAISKHPEMILRPDDFVSWRINWRDKAANIVDLAAELKIGLQSIVFLDDNPVERARVREALSEVFVPDWPNDATLFKSHLLRMDCFDSPYRTTEDSSRTELYAAETRREQFKKTISSHDEWLRSLNTEVVVEDLNAANCVRVVQLLNKTNQMNLSTRRMTDKELLEWLAGGNRKLWAFRVRDRFGDAGLTGLLALDIGGDTSNMCDFVLSCRVMGRNIEQVMIATAVDYCRTLRLRELVATYIQTAKNKPCLELWKNSGFQFGQGNTTFTWTLDKDYPYPDGIKITLLAEGFTDKPVDSLPYGPPAGASGIVSREHL